MSAQALLTDEARAAYTETGKIRLPHARNGHAEEEQFMRYGLAKAANGGDATLVFVGGLGEMIEKYPEFVRDMNAQGINVLVVETRGNGGSSRFAQRMKFNDIVDDLGYFYGSEQFNELTANNTGNVTLGGHSMGGNAVARSLIRYTKLVNEKFKGVELSAPMSGIHWFNPLKKGIAPVIDAALKAVGYGLAGGLNLNGVGADPKSFAKDKFKGNDLTTSQPRWQTWHELQVAHPEHSTQGSSGWFFEATNSAHALKKEAKEYSRRKRGDKLNIPVTVYYSYHDPLVPWHQTYGVASALGAKKYEYWKGPLHELLIESDRYRTPVLTTMIGNIRKAAGPVIP